VGGQPKPPIVASIVYVLDCLIPEIRPSFFLFFFFLWYALIWNLSLWLSLILPILHIRSPWLKQVNASLPLPPEQDTSFILIARLSDQEHPPLIITSSRIIFNVQNEKEKTKNKSPYCLTHLFFFKTQLKKTSGLCSLTRNDTEPSFLTHRCRERRGTTRKRMGTHLKVKTNKKTTVLDSGSGHQRVIM
jgi:hypothetical protein